MLLTAALIFLLSGLFTGYNLTQNSAPAHAAELPAAEGPASKAGPMVLEETVSYGGQQVSIPLMGTVNNISIDWGDGTIDGPFNSQTWRDHNYASAGVYTVKISGTELSHFGSNERWRDTLTKVVSFGTIGITNLDWAFALAPNLTSVPSTLPLGVTSLNGVFYIAQNFNQDLTHWNTSLVTNFDNAFQQASNFNGDISTWDTSSATSMNYMFIETWAFNQDLNDWNVGNVQNFQGTFQGAHAFNSPIGNWNTGSATSTRSMFWGSAFNQDISNWDMHNVIDPVGMFYSSAFNNGSTQNDQAHPMRADGNKWNMSNATDMSWMFAGSPFNQDIKNWDVSNNRRFYETFLNDQSFDQDLSSWHTINVWDFTRMFLGGIFNNGGHPMASSLNGWTTANATTLNSMFQSNRAFDQDVSSWDTTNVIDLNLVFYDTAVFNNGGQPLTWNTSNVKYLNNAFSWARNFNADISSWDVSNVEETSQMFYGAQSFNGDISRWNLDIDWNMNWMFGNSAFNGDISGWNTSSVRYMAYMFSDAYYFNQPIGNWDVSHVEDMSGMFRSTTSFNQPIGNWDVSHVYNMREMFNNAQAFNQPIESWNVTNVQDMSSMFQSTRAFQQSLNGWDMHNVSNVTYMFCNSNFNASIGQWNTSNITNMTGMFQSASDFNQDISGWDVSHVNWFNEMFYYAQSFNQPLDNWNVSSAIGMNNMFGGDQVFNQPLNNWNVSQLQSAGGMFQQAIAFNQDLDNWDTSNLISTNSMFSNATSFNGDISTWNTSRLQNITSMFNGASSFNNDISNWDVSNVDNFDSVFRYATVFNQPVGKWNVDRMWNGNGMFFSAQAFNQDLSTWHTGNLNQAWAMFYDAENFNGNISNWDTHSLQQMQFFLRQAYHFNQDLSNWNFSSVYYADNAFDQTHLSKTNYANLLISLDNQNLHQLNVGAEGLRYLDTAAAARADLVTPISDGGKGWNIYDNGQFEWWTPTVWQDPTASDIVAGQAVSDSTLSGGQTSVAGTWTFTDPTFVPTDQDTQVSVTFTPDDGENYLPISRFINLHSQLQQRTISFTGNNPSTWAWGTTYDASAVQSAGNGQVTYQIISGSCSIDANGLISATRSGTCDFRATVAGDGVYQAATVDGSATIEPNPNALDSGLAIDVYRSGWGQPAMEPGEVCDGAWTHVDNIDVDFDDLYGGMVANCQTDHVVIHYSGFVTFPTSGTYNFEALADDGFFMSLDGTPIISNDWRDKGRGGDRYSGIQIEAGHAYAFQAWYYENGGGANVTLMAGLEGSDLQVIPTEYFTNSGSSFPPTYSIQQTPELSDLIQGQSLSESTLSNGQASVPGTFSLGDPQGVPNAGDQQVDVIFTPDDLSTFSPRTIRVWIHVGRLPRTISLGAAGSNNWFVGDALQLTSNLSGGDGQVSYSVISGPCSIDELNQVTSSMPGTDCTIQVSAYDSSSYEDASDSITIQAKAKAILAVDPTISTAPVASNITYGQSLAESTLSGGVANAAGTFAFLDSSQVLLPGDNTVDVVFTPNDLSAYKIATLQVIVHVDKASRTLSLSNDPGNWKFGQSIKVKATASVGSGKVSYSIDSTSATGCAVDANTGDLTSARAGSCVVKASIVADGRYVGASTKKAYTMAAIAPSAPVISQTRLDGTSISVVWSTPSSDGGSAVVSYKVIATSADNTYTCSTTGVTSCVIGNVAEGTDYKISVVAANDSQAAQSQASAAVVVNVPKPVEPTPDPTPEPTAEPAPGPLEITLPTITPGEPVANPGIGATGDDNAAPVAFNPMTSPEGVKAVTETVTKVTAVVGAVAAAAGAAAAASAAAAGAAGAASAAGAAGAAGAGASAGAGAGAGGGATGGSSSSSSSSGGGSSSSGGGKSSGGSSSGGGGKSSGGSSSGDSKSSGGSSDGNSDSNSPGSVSNIDVDHDQFTIDGSAKGIRSFWN